MFRAGACKAFIFALLLLGLVGETGAWAAGEKPVSVSMSSSNHPLAGSVYEVIAGAGQWQAAPGALFSKLDFYFDEPIALGALDVESCGAKFGDGIDVYFNFDRLFHFVEGGQAKATIKVDVPALRGEKIHSVTLNFRNNVGVCVSRIRLYAALGAAPLKVMTAHLTQGQVSATSSLEPAASHSPWLLFDSRLGSGWATDRTKARIDLEFAEEKRVEKLRFWNGYQRSDVHFTSNSRIKVLSLTGDGAYAQQIRLKDEMGYQDVTLDKPYSGRALKLEVAETYPGTVYRDVALSEMRLYDGQRWALIDPAPHWRKHVDGIVEKFTSAKIAQVLDRQLMTLESSENWLIRLRSDGSFYIRGVSDDQRSSRFYYVLGHFEPTEVKKNGLRLRVFGFKKLASIEMDADSCGRACNSAVDRPHRDVIFQDTLAIRMGNDGYIRIINDTPKKMRRLNFSSLRLRIGVRDD